MDRELTKERLRSLPAIDRLVAAAGCKNDLQQFPYPLLVEKIRQVVDEARQKIQQGEVVDISVPALLTDVLLKFEAAAKPSLRTVINATGVVLHTNLGRAPLSIRAKSMVEKVLTGYCNLEYNIASGERGSRYSHIVKRLCTITGAEDALVVNNNAAAVLLVLSGLAKGKEVIVSRGELVEIGGAFRVPDVLRQSGAQLIEVGTTNKTHLYDYEQAISLNTGAILKVHTSNYKIVGFTAQPDSKELSLLARRHNLPLIEDLGSGTLVPLSFGGDREPSVQESLAVGFDIVTFSGDKLMGGSQGGIIAGKAEYIGRLKKHPLLRAIRIDKLSLAALEGTLMDYQLGNPVCDVPVLNMLHRTQEELYDRAKRLADKIRPLADTGWNISINQLVSQAGGGALPTAALPSYGVAVTPGRYSAAALETQLRVRENPIIVRVQEEKVIFDVRCMTDSDLDETAKILLEISKSMDQ
ncbi:MAG TPA: L-seryl-tRNA(Sec) selenium transferase [Methylomusa anaerophila]|uniref:L-seryl-tRNA(Sec) selenium transferase n=1 Tax=Methylomusa anaerophila TaxID=1930071 RepID=A0A348AHP6_9FIRM|nr:L-seryl-tRNA(Sec) selenium transferase [Methylomusa anaerophila]BBB90594.1 L-seryl-tRNA(Sec) selenium transferase [Methylomusa anaerophila]HML88799.1 L-seryl-tRNA(Sec) selenium transferase [Methylomusa anaerophila]